MVITEMLDYIQSRIEIAEEGIVTTNNRMKCFHQGQIDALEDLADWIEDNFDED